MKIEQISVFIENRAGRLAEILEIFDTNNIAIYALSIADTANFGILRVVTDEPHRARHVLSEGNITVSLTSVISVAAKPGGHGLPDILRVLAREGLTVEYMYAFAHAEDGKGEVRDYVILRVEQDERAIDALTAAGYSGMVFGG